MVIEHFDEKNGLQSLIQELLLQKIPYKLIDWIKNDDPQIPLVTDDIIFFGSQELGEKYRGKGKVFLGNNNFLYSCINLIKIYY